MGKRIGPQRRGHGSPVYRSPSHKHLGAINHPKITEDYGVVVNIRHSPGHTAPVAIIHYEESGKKEYMLAPTGLRVNQKIYVGEKSKLSFGNTLPLGLIPEGTPIYNIEIMPRDGGKLVRSGGASALVVSHGKTSVVRLPSGEFKTFDPRCRATIGILAGGGRKEKPYAKAGKKYHALKSKAKKHVHVSGIAMNAANHPHGGGGHPHVGVPSTVSRHAPPGRKVGRLSSTKGGSKGKKRKR